MFNLVKHRLAQNNRCNLPAGQVGISTDNTSNLCPSVSLHLWLAVLRRT